jgi:hypothetical protein
MTIKAKYPGKCNRCGGDITPGQKINWDKDTHETTHFKCPNNSTATEQAPYKIGGASGYGCSGWKQGQIVRASERLQKKKGYPEWLCVVRSGSEYYSEDGLSFGVGSESGYIYWAECREATQEEIAPLNAEIAKRERKQKIEKRLDEIKQSIRENGECPTGQNNPEGTRLCNTQNIYGGGDWFVVGDEYIWYIKNNGHDGDNWDYNNVVTGGAGAIGWRIDYDEDIAAEIRTANEVV